MKREELVVILVLGALVALAATVRLSGITPAPHGRQAPRPPRRLVRPAPPHGSKPHAGSGRLVWPEPREAYLPRDDSARTLLEAAERIFAEDLLDAAIATYRHFADRYPDLPAAEIASLRIGQCHTLAERHAEAAAQYEQFLETYPDSSLRPMALLWSGVSHIQIGEPAKARERLEEAVTRFPTSAYAEGARQRLQALAKPPPTRPEGHHKSLP